MRSTFVPCFEPSRECIHLVISVHLVSSLDPTEALSHDLEACAGAHGGEVTSDAGPPTRQDRDAIRAGVFRSAGRIAGGRGFIYRSWVRRVSERSIFK